jgi:hypothetical protein
VSREWLRGRLGEGETQRLGDRATKRLVDTATGRQGDKAAGSQGYEVPPGGVSFASRSVSEGLGWVLTR